jgi:hypothetical protein
MSQSTCDTATLADLLRHAAHPEADIVWGVRSRRCARTHDTTVFLHSPTWSANQGDHCRESTGRRHQQGPFVFANRSLPTKLKAMLDKHTTPQLHTNYQDVDGASPTPRPLLPRQPPRVRTGNFDCCRRRPVPC